MATEHSYYVQWMEGSGLNVQETPMGVYPGSSPAMAIQAAAREWSLPQDELEATPMSDHPKASDRGGTS